MTTPSTFRPARLGEPFGLRVGGDGVYAGQLQLHLVESAAGVELVARLGWSDRDAVTRFALDALPVSLGRYRIVLSQRRFVRKLLGLEQVTLQVRAQPCRDQDFEKLVAGYSENQWECSPIMELGTGLWISAPAEVRYRNGLVVCGAYRFSSAELRTHGTRSDERIRIIVSPKADPARARHFDLDTLRWKNGLELAGEDARAGHARLRVFAAASRRCRGLLESQPRPGPPRGLVQRADWHRLRPGSRERHRAHR